jgi:hypothetical protein
VAFPDQSPAGEFQRTRCRAQPCRLTLKRPCSQSRHPGEVRNLVLRAQSNEAYQTRYRRQKKSSPGSRYEQCMGNEPSLGWAGVR